MRIEAQPGNRKPAFVGVARTSDVSAYLRGTQHTTVRDVSYSPFRVAYRESAGRGAPPEPAGQGFWVASSQGSGTQTVQWDARALLLPMRRRPRTHAGLSSSRSSTSTTSSVR